MCAVNDFFVVRRRLLRFPTFALLLLLAHSLSYIPLASFFAFLCRVSHLLFVSNSRTIMVCAFSVFVSLLFDKANEYRITPTTNDICVLMILTRPTMNWVVVLKIQTTLKRCAFICSFPQA